ncbi:MAG: hypothetical protein ACKPKO_14710 [Candidatus Fonsibacter sp.]
MLQQFKDMVGMNDNGNFDVNVASNYLNNFIETTDAPSLNLMLAEIDTVTENNVIYFHKAITYALVPEYKAIELACGEFQKIKSVQATVIAYIYAHLAMASDNGQHNNTAVRNMIIERKKAFDKQNEMLKEHQISTKFVTMARDQLLAEAREQLIAEARQQLLAEAREQLAAETNTEQLDKLQD